jgi:hypothetical protein
MAVAYPRRDTRGKASSVIRLELAITFYHINYVLLLNSHLAYLVMSAHEQVELEMEIAQIMCKPLHNDESTPGLSICA